MVKMNESAENIGFVECRMKDYEAKWVMQLVPPQGYYQVHEFESTEHYLKTLGQSKQWVHTQVGSRSMALTFNGCMMHVDIGQDNASETAKKLIASLKEAAKWYDEFLKSEEGRVKSENIEEMKTIHDELEELGAIMDATTDENDTRYQEKFLYIKAHYPTKEDANTIADFILRRYDALGKKVEEFGKQLNMLDQ